MQWKFKVNIANIQVKYMYLLSKASTCTHVKNETWIVEMSCCCHTCLVHVCYMHYD